MLHASHLAGRTKAAMLASSLAALVLAGSGSIAQAATRYVSTSGSGSACTQASPCGDLDTAYAAAVAGDVVQIADGSYPAQALNEDTSKGNTSVIFRPADSANVVIDDISLGRYYNDKGASNVEFRDLTLNGFSARRMSGATLVNVTINGGFWLDGTKDVAFLGGSVGGINSGHPEVKTWTRPGMADVIPQNITFDGVYFHDVRLNNSGDHTNCLHIQDVINLVVRNNRFHNCDVIDFLVSYGAANVLQDIVVENNIFEAPSSSFGVPGYYAVNFDDGGVNVNIRNNSSDHPWTLPTDGSTGTYSNWKVSGNVWPSGPCRSSIVYRRNVRIGNSTCDASDKHVSGVGWDTNFRPLASSPLIDAGDSANAPATDRDGNARPFGSVPDAGAYEYGSSTPPPSNAAPDTSISAGPTGSTTATDTGFSFAGRDGSTPAGSLSFECKLDADAWAACTSPRTYSGLTVGSHTFSVRATDGAGVTDASPATASWTVTSPGSASTLFGNENVESLVDHLIAGQSEAWPFTAASAGSAGTVSLYVDTSSTGQGAELGVYADNAGLPGTLLGKGTLSSPTAGWNTAAVPAFSVTAGSQYWIAIFGTGGGELRFRTHSTGGDCLARLSATNSWSSLPGTWSGTGTASECPVSAYVTAGAGSPPPADTTAPTTSISSAPSGSTTSTSASFSFTGSDNVTAAGSLTFECQMDSGAWAACTSPKAYSGLAVGAHTFRVRAKDSAGNVDASPATASWTIATSPPPPDTTAPDTTITSAPASSGSATSATFAFSGSDNVTPAGSLTFQCSVDLAAWAACTSPKSYSGLAVGNHNVRIRARDAAGNVDGSAASYSWTIVAPDTTAPDTTTTSGPDGLSLSTNASFMFTGSDNVTPSNALTFACSLDGGPWLTCTSPQGYDNLSLLGHSFAVRATDAAGNIDPSPSVYSWSVAVPTAPGTVAPTDPTGAPTTPPATTPTVTLAAPTEGSTFTSRLAYSATAAAPHDATIKRVEFWFDANRVARDTAAPYAYTWKVPSSTKYGLHTVSARAYDSADRVASVATTVMRRTGAIAQRAAAGRRVTASLTANSGPSGGTELAGRTRSRRPVRVKLAPCSGEGKTVRAVQVTLRPASGKLSGRHRTGRLCVVGLTPQP